MSNQTPSGPRLQRDLTTFDLIAIGIGAIVGAAIFVVPGIVAANYAGPATSVSFVIAAIGAGCVALCYAELAAMIPAAGSAYAYAREIAGELFSWLIGWNLCLEYLLGLSAVAIGWSGYAVAFLKHLGIGIPAAITTAPFSLDASDHLTASAGILNLPAVLLIVCITAVSYRGLRTSARANAVLVNIKLSVIFVFVAFGAFYVNPHNWHPFIPANAHAVGHFGWSGIMRGAAVVFFAYLGFDCVSAAGEETGSPQSNLPRGILISLALCTLLYIGVSVVLTGLAPYPTLGVADPLYEALERAGAPGFLGAAVAGGAIIGAVSAVLVILYGQSRVTFAMARDGLLPEPLARIHPRFGTPYWSIVASGVIATLFAAFLPLELLTQLVSIGALSAFVFVCVGVLVLRYLEPQRARPFRTPLSPLVPCVGILSCVAMMVSLSTAAWVRLLVWIVVGLAIYFGMSSRRPARSDA